jgi:hypothetical protein
MRPTLSTFKKHNMGRVRRMDFDKAASIVLVVRSLRRRRRGKAKNDSGSAPLLQPPHRSGVSPARSRAEDAKGGQGLHPALGQTDGLGSAFHFAVGGAVSKVSPRKTRRVASS